MLRNISFFLLVSFFIAPAFSHLIAQDTITVQAFTFADINKRRDKYLFPDSSNHYRKILMEYTLKCDPLTPWDQYDCGEWDYLTYNMVYDHRGILDSTRMTNFNYQVGGTTPDSFGISWSPVWDYYTSWQYQLTHST